MNLRRGITWTTQKDSRVCPICKALEGYTWFLEVGESVPKQLIHPVYGPVYDTRPAEKGSLVKGEKGHICRCTLKYGFYLSRTDTANESVLADTSNKNPDEKSVNKSSHYANSFPRGEL